MSGDEAAQQKRPSLLEGWIAEQAQKIAKAEAAIKEMMDATYPVTPERARYLRSLIVSPGEQFEHGLDLDEDPA